MSTVSRISRSPLLAATFGAVLLAGSYASVAHAEGTLTGEIGVSLIIGDGCTVSNGSAAAGSNQWGTLDFGEYPDLTSVIDGQVVGEDGSNAISITCSTGLSPTLTIDGGLYDNGTLRNVSSDNGTSLVAYRLYSDAARSTEVVVDAPISLVADGTALELPLYGRILPADQASTAPAAGTYSDTLVATLAW